MTIFLLSGDHDIPGCSHFNSSKSMDRLPLTSLRIFFPSMASIREMLAIPDLSSRIAILLPSGEIAGDML